MSSRVRKRVLGFDEWLKEIRDMHLDNLLGKVRESKRYHVWRGI